MAYLKFNAEKIFDGYRFHEATALITDESGTIEALVPLAEAGEDVRQMEGILCPGFINCHCHLEISHMKGLIPERTGLVKFVLDVVQRRHFPEQQILAAIENAENDLINTGVVAVG